MFSEDARGVGIVKKGNTMKVSMLLNSPFTLKELFHMIDISVIASMGPI
jgi:hypothetical protein